MAVRVPLHHFLLVMCCVVTVAFFAIGLGTFLSGCDPSIQKYCVKYTPVFVKILGQDSNHETCEHCGKNSCAYYDCWNSWANALYVEAADSSGGDPFANTSSSLPSCQVWVDQSVTGSSVSQALADAVATYTVGQVYWVLLERGSSNCYSPTGSTRSLFITGVFFLSATGVMLPILIGMTIWNRKVTRRVAVEARQNNYTSDDTAVNDDVGTPVPATATNPGGGGGGGTETETEMQMLDVIKPASFNTGDDGGAYGDDGGESALAGVDMVRTTLQEGKAKSSGGNDEGDGDAKGPHPLYPPMSL